jgi:hypothetical protein
MRVSSTTVETCAGMQEDHDIERRDDHKMGNSVIRHRAILPACEPHWTRRTYDRTFGALC